MSVDERRTGSDYKNQLDPCSVWIACLCRVAVELKKVDDAMTTKLNGQVLGPRQPWVKEGDSKLWCRGEGRGSESGRIEPFAAATLT